MISFAQNREDVLINRVFPGNAGFYIDIGASEPVAGSVTKFFSLSGWSGINVEPCPEAFHALANDRPRDINLQCAVGKESGQSILYMPQNRAMSTIIPKQVDLLSESQKGLIASIPIQVRTLADICEEYVKTEIDFLKIDAEGAEEEVIRGGDWVRFRPKLLVIEATHPWSSNLNCDAWDPLLIASDYLFVHFDGINRYYLRLEDRQLADQLSVPVNFLDFYVTHHELQLQQAVGQLQSQIRLSQPPAPS